MKKRMGYVADGGYVRPKKANELMKAAQSIKRTVYIYGATGYGKTAFVADFLAHKKSEYYTMSDAALLGAAEENAGQPRTVVVDDLHLLSVADERERQYAILERLAGDPNVWLILISRAPLPAWLNPLHVRRIFMMIGERELAFSEKEEEAYLSNKWELALMPQSAQYLRKLSGGCPLALRIAAMELRSLPEADVSSEKRQKEELAAIERARKSLWEYLQEAIIKTWDVELQEFLTALSVVDSFDLPLARQITKRSDAGKLIVMAQEIGNFLLADTEAGHTIYRYVQPLRLSLRKHLTERYSQEYIEGLYYSAGTGYELQGRFLEALDMYEKCRNEDGISRILIANARKDAGSGHYWEMRRYYLALSDETIRQSPELMAGMSLLQSIALNDEESERWYKALADYVKEQTGNTKKSAQARLFYLDIALPQRGTAQMTDILKQAWTFVTKRQAILPALSLTNNQPTMMHGGKDFCEWSRHDRELAKSIGKPVEKLLGSFGKGLVNLALAESFFEKGAEAHEVQILAQKGWIQALSGGRSESVFVAVGLLAWQSVLDNRMKEAIEILESFRGSAAEEAPQLLSGIDTLKTRFLLYTGKSGEVAGWMALSPNENAEFCTLERYRYITKARIYLSMGQNERAFSLLGRLLYYAEKRQRTYLWIEAQVLLAVTKFRMGEKDWQKTLQDAIAKAEDYHFVRVLTREGAALNPLLKAGGIWQDDAFRKQVMKECKLMAQFYPAYLNEKQDGGAALSDKAIIILRLQAEGKTVEQIAGELYLSKAGVKYYIQDTYKKLGVNGKAAAINEAMNRKIL